MLVGAAKVQLVSTRQRVYQNHPIQTRVSHGSIARQFGKIWVRKFEACRGGNVRKCEDWSDLRPRTGGACYASDERSMSCGEAFRRIADIRLFLIWLRLAALCSGKSHRHRPTRASSLRSSSGSTRWRAISRLPRKTTGISLPYRWRKLRSVSMSTTWRCAPSVGSSG